MIAPFSKCASSARKRKAGVFKFRRFEERFEKFCFRRRISASGRPKAAFSNFLLRNVQSFLIVAIRALIIVFHHNSCS